MADRHNPLIQIGVGAIIIASFAVAVVIGIVLLALI